MSPLPVLRACPQCKDPLVEITHDEISALGCRGCGGTWIENETMTRVIYALEPSSIEVGDDAAKMARMPFPPHAASPPCPTCHTPMRTEILAGTDVEVDVCEAHGTWLDRGELQTVVQELMARQAPQETTNTFVEPTKERAAAPHPITPEELRAQMIAQYGVDPSLQTPARYYDGSQTGYGTGVDIGLSILGFLLR
jgi:Zn-finger nucleic acid-binding protein